MSLGPDVELGSNHDREGSSVGTPRFGRPRDWAIGAALLAAVVFAVEWTVGWGPLLLPWRTLSPLLLVVLFGLTALSYVLRAVRVYDYFGPRFRGCFPIVLRLSMLHNTANNLLPMRAGEMVFPWLMQRYFGHGFLDAAAALLWIRILDLHFLVLIGILILYLRDPLPLWWIAALAWLAGLLLFLPLRGLVTGKSESSGRAPAVKLMRLVRRVLGAAPAKPRIIARVYLWTALTWTLKFAAFAVLLEHFLPVEFWRLLTGVMGAELSSVLPFHGIAGSGSYELAVVAALAPLGVDPRLALAGAVNLHLFLLGSTLVLGVLALLLPKASVPIAGNPPPSGR
ncbi:lysylphosphatidylglycerol synthase transmembrane domain-containing protein [Thiocapsa bogorovii]|uniref:lysylphosphatidylglycerol synthase transmembrane domain-containing protein n=1 Tax=Thiocapsa bogorovii TaxID=521689 RepID=UPI001E49737C|nr:lysylphosphatidylglycerol synthase transmembrane domain-containing protein [Thiocapsa bogorovii]UHD17342.1 flippase-like domain-containing protein [Thiocapsa bogorovii]